MKVNFAAFCTRISNFMHDKINYAFFAFTMSPDGVPQSHVIPNDDDNVINEIQWYTPANAHQNKNPNKHVCFSKSKKGKLLKYLVLAFLATPGQLSQLIHSKSS